VFGWSWPQAGRGVDVSICRKKLMNNHSLDDQCYTGYWPWNGGCHRKQHNLHPGMQLSTACCFCIRTVQAVELGCANPQRPCRISKFGCGCWHWGGSLGTVKHNPYRLYIELYEITIEVVFRPLASPEHSTSIQGDIFALDRVFFSG